MTDTVYADISEWQASADIGAYAQQSQVLMARTYNGFRADHCVPARVNQMRSMSGLTSLWYAYLVAGGDPVQQARAFMTTIGSVLPGEGVVLDLEEGAGDQTGRAHAWFTEIDPHQHNPGGAALYTYQSFLDSHLGGAARWAGRPLIVAKYSQPEPADGQVAWQFTEGINNNPVNFAGIGRVDGNIHHGDRSSLVGALGLGGPWAPSAPLASLHPKMNAAVVAGMATPSGLGYYLVGADGGVFTFGDAVFAGSLGAIALSAPICGGAVVPGGYVLVGSDGGIFDFGTAPFYGSLAGTRLNRPVEGMAMSPDNKGYWMVAGDGGVFTYGDAAFDGSEGGATLNGTIIGLCPHPGGGYWLVATDGGIFSFDAPFFGSTGDKTLNGPIVAMAATPDGKGYWLAGNDGGVFSFGSAGFFGSAATVALNAPVVSMATTPDGLGYWLFAADGGVFSFGSAKFYGTPA